MDTDMTPPEERRHSMDDLVEAIKGLTEQMAQFDKNQQVVLSRMSTMEKTVDSHEEILVDGAKGGLVSDFLRLKDSVKNMNKLLWALLSLLTLGVGVWIGELIKSHFFTQ